MATMIWRKRHNQKSNPQQQNLGILAFETAKAMSRLIALHKSLIDVEFFELRKVTMKSEGVAYLNSTDETYLFALACAEKLEELDRVAMSAARLGRRCCDFEFNSFGSQLSVANMEKVVHKMEKYVTATANLYSSFEALREMEISEKKLQMWKLNTGPKRSPAPNLAYFDEKIAYQRKQVQYYKNSSLWNQTFDKTVALMAKSIYVVYARICIVFSPFVSGLPCFHNASNPRNDSNSNPKPERIRIHPEADYCLLADRPRQYEYEHRGFKSGPIQKASRKAAVSRFYSHELLPKYPISGISKTVQVLKGKTSSSLAIVGTAGMAMRYANIIILAERYLQTSTCVDDDARGILYEMLPLQMRMKVKEKLRSLWCGEQEESCRSGRELAEGWRDAVETILNWLAPIAQDTVTWRMERNLEKQRFDTNPTVLLLQTLHFSDLEKTEAAIVEVLVGLSCMYRFDNQWLCSQFCSGRHCSS